MSQKNALGHNGLSPLTIVMIVCQIDAKGQIIANHDVQVGNNAKIDPNG
jgi:hypothetical protein